MNSFFAEMRAALESIMLNLSSSGLRFATVSAGSSDSRRLSGNALVAAHSFSCSSPNQGGDKSSCGSSSGSCGTKCAGKQRTVLILVVIAVLAALFVIFVMPAKIWRQGPASGQDEVVKAAPGQVQNSDRVSPDAPAAK